MPVWCGNAGEFYRLRCTSAVGDVGRPGLPRLSTHPRHARRQPSVVSGPDISQLQWQRGRRPVAEDRVAVQRWRTSTAAERRHGRRRLRLFAVQVRHGRRRRGWSPSRRQRHVHAAGAAAASAARSSSVGSLLSQHRDVHRGGIRISGRRGRLLTERRGKYRRHLHRRTNHYLQGPWVLRVRDGWSWPWIPKEHTTGLVNCRPQHDPFDMWTCG